jgi:hypothetical protein
MPDLVRIGPVKVNVFGYQSMRFGDRVKLSCSNFKYAGGVDLKSFSQRSI